MFDPEKEIDAALQWLLDEDLISMTWDDEAEELVFFMTDVQQMIHDLDWPLPD